MKLILCHAAIYAAAVDILFDTVIVALVLLRPWVVRLGASVPTLHRAQIIHPILCGSTIGIIQVCIRSHINSALVVSLALLGYNQYRRARHINALHAVIAELRSSHPLCRVEHPLYAELLPSARRPPVA